MIPRELRILLVDDNPQDRKLVFRELRKACPEAAVSEALDEPDLERLLGGEAFDLVVTDYHLHWSDGLAVLRAVKSRWANCPVIMFTGTGNEEVAVEAMKLGLDDYIIKNVQHLVRLRGAIEAALSHSAQKARAAELSDRLESLLTQFGVGAFSCTPDGDLIDVNDALISLLECRTSDCVRNSPFAEAIRVSFTVGPVGTLAPRQSWEWEVSVDAGADRPRLLRVKTTRFDAAHEGPRFHGLVEDVTQQRNREAELQAAAVAAAQLAMLSPREREVLDHVVEGAANKVIARRLDISEKTVEKHRSSLMHKLNAHSVAELVRLTLAAKRAGS